VAVHFDAVPEEQPDALGVVVEGCPEQRVLE